MLHREVNQRGAISIDQGVVNEMIDEVMDAYNGKAWLANYKGALSDVMIRLRNYGALAEKHVEMTERGLFIRLFLIIRFGAGITEVTSGIMDRLAGALIDQLELPLDNIEIIITGVLSKNIAKRSIVVDYRSLLNSRLSRP